MSHTQTNSFTDGSHGRRNTLGNPKEKGLKVKLKLSQQHIALSSTTARNGPRPYLSKDRLVSRKHSASSSMLMSRKVSRRSQATTYATSMEDAHEADPLNDLKVRAMLGSNLFQRSKRRPIQGT